MRLAIAALLLLATAAHATPPEDQWFTVLLDGRKIGNFESSRIVRDGKVETTQTLDVTLERAGISLGLVSSESATETTDGKPLAFSSRSKMSGIESRIDGRIDNGNIQVTTNTGGAAQTRTLPWPSGALLPEGTRLAGLRAGLAPGTHYDVVAFQPSSLDTARVTTRVVSAETVDLPGGKKRLTRVDQDMALAGTTMTSRSWVDGEQTVYKLVMPLLGVDLVLLACDRACATAPNQGTDVFARTMLVAPRALAPTELKGAMRYTLAARDGAKLPDLVATDEQRVEAKGRERIVTISAEARAAAADERPSPDDFRANDWLQSNAPEVAALAKQAVGDGASADDKMRRIETFVRGFIKDKTLNVGYASALEVARKPEGDCTEHAVLVAALGRAAGIATRVVDGLAYAPGFAGKDQVFVPHAWAQAWVDGRWRSYDAALGGFDSGHIALAVGDGDPWRFYAGLEQLGTFEVRKAEALPVH